jgi:aldose 1-epimerase
VIVLKSAALTAHILERGAVLAGLWLDGRARSLCLGYASGDLYATDTCYLGALVGPVANRVKSARVAIGTRNWTMPGNEGTTCLHSGPQGLHSQTWTIAERDPDRVRLELNLPHGACGLPGNRRIEATYAIGDGGCLTLTVSATTDQTTAMNIAHHPYWTLDDHPTVGMHSLTVAADRLLPVDDANLPTGEIRSVAGTEFDFRVPRRLPVDKAIDVNLCLSSKRHATPRPIAVLTGGTGIRMEIETTEPGLQVYNGAGLQPREAAMLAGQALLPFAGVALEPQGWPDALNHTNFPSTLLHPVAQYHQVSRYRFST